MSKEDTGLTIAGKTYKSRLLVGSGKYKDLEETRRLNVSLQLNCFTFL